MKNAADIATGASSKPGESLRPGDKLGVNCQELKICRTGFVKKTCNEAKPLKKICEKVPKIITSTRDIIYPNCKNVAIVQGAYSRCPSGYQEEYYT